MLGLLIIIVSKFLLVRFSIGLIILISVISDTDAATARIVLARDQHATMPVVVAQDASPRVRQAAMNLADYLGRISDTTFEVITGDGTRGIVVGLPQNFPRLTVGRDLQPETIEQRERYLLRSYSDGLHVIGATETAVEDAVSDLLYRLGYRQFFPGPTWEIVPKIQTLEINIDVEEHPDYISRRIWYGQGVWDYNDEYYRQWSERNRVRDEAFRVSSGHAYQSIIRSYEPEFKAHPEYLCPPVSGAGSTFRILNPDLRQLVTRYAFNFFEKNPQAETVSVEPSDDAGWCEEKAGYKAIPISDRVLLLANQVAESLEKKYTDKYVAFYAYQYHSPPPETVRAHPKVIVNIATSFIHGGYTLDQLIEGWHNMGVRQMGIREYYSVNTWDRDLPGSSRGSDLEYLAKTIPHFHTMGARFMSAESSDNWGINGLGYYVAARLLWHVDEAKHLNSIIDDFLNKSFGPASGPMVEFYALINRANQPLLSQDLVGRMYRLLDKAIRLTDDPKIQARLDDLTLYTRYVELFRDYQSTRGDDRQKAFEQVIHHAYRMRRTMMIDVKALYRDLSRRDKSVSVPEGGTWDVPEGRNPWKSSQVFTTAELSQIRGDGIARNRLLNWIPVAYSNHLIPFLSPDRKDNLNAEISFLDRGYRRFYIWMDEAPATLRLKVYGGLIAWYRDRGNVKIDLYAMKPALERLVDSNHEIPPDGQEHTVILKTSDKGLHRLDIDDGRDLTRIVFEPNEKLVLEMGREQAPYRVGRWTLYFYVPKGAKVVAGYRAIGRIEDARGQVRYQAIEADGADYFTIQTPEGQDGQIWRCVNCAGAWKLMTVPPFFAPSPQQLLVPAETVH